MVGCRVKGKVGKHVTRLFEIVTTTRGIPKMSKE